MRKQLRIVVVFAAIAASALPASADTQRTIGFDDGRQGFVSTIGLYDRAGAKAGHGVSALCQYVSDGEIWGLTATASSGSNTGAQPTSTQITCELRTDRGEIFPVYAEGKGANASGRGEFHIPPDLRVTLVCGYAAAAFDGERDAVKTQPACQGHG